MVSFCMLKKRLWTNKLPCFSCSIEGPSVAAQNTNNNNANNGAGSTANSEKEEVMDAEMKAAKERATVPLEQRVKQFKEMLREKDVRNFDFNLVLLSDFPSTFHQN